MDRLAGLPANPGMNGASFKELGDTPTCVGVRTATQKLIHYRGKPDLTEAYDLAKDLYELKNLAKDKNFTTPLRAEMIRLADKVKYPLPEEITAAAEK
jgi:hypothetical protein